jgi:hypothetical protein
VLGLLLTRPAWWLLVAKESQPAASALRLQRGRCPR